MSVTNAGRRIVFAAGKMKHLNNNSSFFRRMKHGRTYGSYKDKKKCEEIR